MKVEIIYQSPELYYVDLYIENSVYSGQCVKKFTKENKKLLNAFIYWYEGYNIFHCIEDLKHFALLKHYKLDIAKEEKPC